MTDTLKIEAGKEYLLRNGWRMRCTEVIGGKAGSILGWYSKTAGGEMHPADWELDGRWLDVSLVQSSNDIIAEAHKPIEVDCWVWVWADGDTSAGTRPVDLKDFDEGSYPPVAQIHIKRTVHHGEGL